MKPRLIDRLVVICLCINLVLGIWYIGTHYDTLRQVAVHIF